MTVWRLLAREIAYRRGNFALGAVSLAAAVAFLVASLGVLQRYASTTARSLDRKEAALAQSLAGLQQALRTSLRGLGPSLVILPADQDLTDWHSSNYGTMALPEDAAHRLSALGLPSLESLVPILRRKLKWPETGWTVIVVGVGAWSPPLQGTSSGPFRRMAPGEIDLGYELHHALGYGPGQPIRLLGREWSIACCREEQGDSEDVTVWMALSDAQELFSLPGCINEIRAVDAPSAWGSGPAVEAELEAALPEARVIRVRSSATARADALGDTAREAQRSLELERAKANRISAQLRRLAVIAVPLVAALCTVWLAVLMSGNVRERRGELAMQRAMGYGAWPIAVLLLLRAAAMGMAGGTVGFALGRFLVGIGGGDAGYALTRGGLHQGLIVLAGAVAVALVSTVVPLWRTVRRDPALDLNEA